MSEQSADQVRTHSSDCYLWHPECKPTCEVCWEPVEGVLELWQEIVDGNPIRGHRACVQGDRTDDA
jgi:hypothetical protein